MSRILSALYGVYYTSQLRESSFTTDTFKVTFLAANARAGVNGTGERLIIIVGRLDI